MDLFDVARSCARRWYVFLPLILVVAYMSYNAYVSVQPVYTANAVVGLAPSSTKVANAVQGERLPRNGLLEIGGAQLIANMTAVGLREPAVVDNVVQSGGLPNYSTKIFEVGINQLPMVSIEVTDPDPAMAVKTLEILVRQETPTILQNLQQDAQVHPSEMVTSFVVSLEDSPTAATPSRTRSTVALFLAGVGLSVLLTVVLDVVLTRLQARRRRRPSPLPAEFGTDADAGTPASVPTDVRLPESAASTAGGARQD